MNLDTLYQLAVPWVMAFLAFVIVVLVRMAGRERKRAERAEEQARHLNQVLAMFNTASATVVFHQDGQEIGRVVVPLYLANAVEAKPQVVNINLPLSTSEERA